MLSAVRELSSSPASLSLLLQTGESEANANLDTQANVIASVRRVLAALSVLGGHLETVREGGRVVVVNSPQEQSPGVLIRFGTFQCIWSIVVLIALVLSLVVESTGPVKVDDPKLVKPKALPDIIVRLDSGEDTVVSQ